MISYIRIYFNKININEKREKFIIYFIILLINITISILIDDKNTFNC